MLFWTNLLALILEIKRYLTVAATEIAPSKTTGINFRIYTHNKQCFELTMSLALDYYQRLLKSSGSGRVT
ncbi:unnamed protein product [Callosobruchus maculatus]|uniref:Uncharacterized protein n=1 Tax=Callosobruchus maculatus TaxID=64391 RepID=A0A653D5N4_CALMS|nr:unnamed protein product [Callosobruchus maculatus]